MFYYLAQIFFSHVDLAVRKKKSGGYPLQGTVMQIEKTVIYDRLIVSKAH